MRSRAKPPGPGTGRCASRGIKVGDTANGREWFNAFRLHLRRVNSARTFWFPESMMTSHNPHTLFNPTFSYARSARRRLAATAPIWAWPKAIAPPPIWRRQRCVFDRAAGAAGERKKESGVIEDDRLVERPAHGHRTGVAVAAQEGVFPARGGFIAEDRAANVVDAERGKIGIRGLRQRRQVGPRRER